MKGLIYVPSTEETEWIQEVLPGISPAELPIAGKRYIDYAIEHAVRHGYEMVEVLDWHYSQAVAADFANLTGNAIPVFYQEGTGEMPKSREDLSSQSTPLTQSLDSDISVVLGLQLGDLHIRNIADWHKANMDILTRESGNAGGQFTLPGYSAEDGVFLGQNVIMEHGVELKKPLLIQDNALCARNVRLDGSCIIGKGAFIDEGARLERTVVGDDTYVGTGLELVDKIVIGHRVIDVTNGVWMDVEEPGVASRIGGGKGFFRRILDFLFGNSRGRM